MTFGRISSHFILLLYFTKVRTSLQMLNVSPLAGEDVVNNIRKHVFVESRYVTLPEKSKVCDSLAGPNCGFEGLQFAGVIPSVYIGDLDVDADVLHASLPSDLWKFKYSLDGSFEPSFKLNLHNLTENSTSRIANHYDLMPRATGGVLAELEGRWFLDDSVSMETFLPGYINFSSPVLVQSLWAQLPFDDLVDPVVMVVFRLGTETVWSTSAIVEGGRTLDLTSRGLDGHGSLRICDQIVLFSTVKGLKIVSIDFQQVSSPQPVLVPSVLLVPTSHGLMLKHEAVDAAAIATRQLVSIYEAIMGGYVVNAVYTQHPYSPDLKLVELAANDMGFFTPIVPFMSAVKNGEIRLPNELRKALLKYEKDVLELAKTITIAKRSDLFPIENFAPLPLSRKARMVGDLVIAALLYL